jgi:hypothetical protein
MNTIAGRAENACADAGEAGCREHAPRQSAPAITKAANPYVFEMRGRIVPPAKVYPERK